MCAVSFVQSYRRANGFLVTQIPLKETVTDFWRLVTDYESKTIVVLVAPGDSKVGMQS
jgi:protein tyrosine phosphatase